MAMFVDDTIVVQYFQCDSCSLLHRALCFALLATFSSACALGQKFCPMYVQHNEWALSVSHTSLPLHLCSKKLKKMELQLKQFREKYLEM